MTPDREALVAKLVYDIIDEHCDPILVFAAIDALSDAPEPLTTQRILELRGFTNESPVAVEYFARKIEAEVRRRFGVKT